MSVSPVVVAGFRAVLDSYTIGTRLAAELIAAATVHRSRIALSATNVGRTWPAVFATEGIDLHIVP